MSAWLELVAPGEAAVHGLTDGRLPLFGYDRFLLGRARDCDVAIASSQLGRRHTAVSWRSGLWQVEDLGGNNPARLNGGLLGRAARTLVPGDRLEFPGGPTFRYGQDAAAEQRSTTLEAAIAEAPHDPQRWRVYADWLQERGERLGEWMLTASSTGEGPLARHFLAALTYQRRQARYTFQHGFLDAVQLYPSADATHTLPPVLIAQLCGHPLGRFLRTVEVDLAAFQGRLSHGGPPCGPPAQTALLVLDALEQHAGPTLERAVLPLTRAQRAQAPQLDARIEKCWQRMPRLQVSFATPPPRPAWLELAAGDPAAARGFVDGRYPLQLPRVDLGAARSSSLVVESKLHPPRLTCLERMAGAWVLRHEFHAHPVRIDGAAVTADVWLTDGLVFELPSGHRLRFRCP